jgi:hypothetical protein
MIIYGIYDDGVTVAAVKPPENVDENIYMAEEWAMQKSEQAVSLGQQIERSKYFEEIRDALGKQEEGRVKFELPEQLYNRASSGLENVFEELGRNPLTREVHGNYIFPGDREFDEYSEE